MGKRVEGKGGGVGDNRTEDPSLGWRRGQESHRVVRQGRGRVEEKG